MSGIIDAPKKDPKKTNQKKSFLSLDQLIKIKRPRLPLGSSFGNSAIFPKIRRFPSPPHEGFGFIGNRFSVFIEF
jgi:hypothetical protein